MKPINHVEGWIDRPFSIGKNGIWINVSSTKGKRQKYNYYISVGGISWKRSDKRSWKKISWDRIQEIFMDY